MRLRFVVEAEVPEKLQHLAKNEEALSNAENIFLADLKKASELFKEIEIVEAEYVKDGE